MHGGLTVRHNILILHDFSEISGISPRFRGLGGRFSDGDAPTPLQSLQIGLASQRPTANPTNFALPDQMCVADSSPSPCPRTQPHHLSGQGHPRRPGQSHSQESTISSRHATIPTQQSATLARQSLHRDRFRARLAREKLHFIRLRDNPIRLNRTSIPRNDNFQAEEPADFDGAER